MAAVREGVLSREIALLRIELVQLQDDLAEAERRAADAEWRAAEAEATVPTLALAHSQLRAISTSRSWRVTAPLRVATTAARRLIGRPYDPYAGRLQITLAATGAYASALPAPAPDLVALLPPAAVARGPSRRRRMLVAADFLPLYDQQSGGRRMFEMIGLIAETGWDVVFLSITPQDALPGVLSQPEGRQRYEESLRRAGVVEIVYGTEEARRYLEAAGRDVDCALLSFPSIATEMMPLVRTYCPTCRIIFDMVDFHGVRMAREATLTDDPALAEEAGRQQAIEVACAKAADLTFAVTGEERAALLQLVPSAVVEVMPNIFTVPERPLRGTRGRAGLLFVGGFWHKPNGDAMLWFARSIWPLIRREAPEATLTIIGSYPSDEVLALGQLPGITVRGYVADLAAEFDQHRAFVAPLRYGAGMKGKVGESMINGLPVVATPIGAEGMGLQSERHLLVAEDEAEFARQVLRLLADDALWERLAQRGRQHIVDTLSRGVVGARLRDILNG
jgi:hypothetical protein